MTLRPKSHLLATFVCTHVYRLYLKSEEGKAHHSQEISSFNIIHPAYPAHSLTIPAEVNSLSSSDFYAGRNLEGSAQ